MIVKGFIYFSCYGSLVPLASSLNMHSRFRDGKKPVIAKLDIMVRWLMSLVYHIDSFWRLTRPLVILRCCDANVF